MHRSSFVALAIALTLGAAVALAGDLEPPPGPVAPTMKRLDEVEPRRAVNRLPGDATAKHVIVASGSYYLTADIVGEVSKDGIRVEADDVTIDLAGFVIDGQGLGVDGIEPVQVTGLTVKNGSLRGWAGYPVFGFASYSSFVDLVAFEAEEGFRVIGERNLFLRVKVTAIGEIAIETGDGAIVRDSMVEGAFTGIGVGRNSIVESCTVEGSTRGIFAFESTIVRNNAVNGNVLTSNTIGIFAGVGSSVLDNRVAEIEGQAISVARNALVRGNVCRSSEIGLSATDVVDPSFVATSRFEGNHLVGNTIGIRLPTSGNIVVGNTIVGSATPIADSGTNLVGPLSSDPASASAWANFEFDSGP
jgi:hypothetical protein